MSETQNKKNNKPYIRVSLPILFIIMIVLSLLSALVLGIPLSSFYRNTETIHRIAASRMLESSLFMNNRMNEEVSENRDRNLKSMMQFLAYLQEKNGWSAEELKNHADGLGIGTIELIETYQSADQYLAGAEIPDGQRYYCIKPDENHILILKDDPASVYGMRNNVSAVLAACTQPDSENDPVFIDAFAIDRKNQTVITAEGITPLAESDRIIPVSEKEYEYDGRIYKLSSRDDGSAVMHHYDNNYDIDFYTVYSEINSERMAVSVNRFVMIIFLCSSFSFVIYNFYVRQFKIQYPYDNEYNSKAIRKRTLISIVFVVAVNLITALYAQCFYSIASLSMYDRNLISEAGEIITVSNENTSRTHNFLQNDYLKTASVISDYLSRSLENQESSELNRIRDIFGFDYIVLYDLQGIERSSDGSVWNLSLPADSDDPSFAMNDLRFGASGVFVDPYYNSYTGRRSARAAVPVKSADPSCSGFLELGISTLKTDTIFSPENIYCDIADSVPDIGTVIIFIDENTGIITDSTLKKYENRTAEAVGFSQEFLTPGYFNTMKADGVKSYVSTGRVPGRLMSLVLNSSVLRALDGIYIAGITVLSILLCTVLLYLMRLSREKAQIYDSGWFRILDSTHIMKSGGAETRPEERIEKLLKALLILGTAVMIVNFQGQMLIRKENPLFTEIMKSGWTKGLNIFALTSSILLVAWTCIAVFIIRRILKQIGMMGSLHVETVTRLLRSAVRYIAVVAVFYIMMLNFGLNPEALATSAGLIGIAVGIGARDLITDIIAGLFIIFERDYEVGDTVEVSGFTGEVNEIGMRVTKLTNRDGEEKIINNRNMINIVKIPPDPVRIRVSFRVPYDTSIEALNEIITKESPLLKEKYPELAVAPEFKGILEFEEVTILCYLEAKCLKEHKNNLTAALSNELKRMMDENGIPMYKERRR